MIGIRSIASLMILCLLVPYSGAIWAVDEYYNFPSVSVKGTASYEKERNLCIFSFRSQTKEEKFQYLSKGLPSVILSEIRNLEYVYVEYPKPQIIYHSFGPNPEKTLNQLVEEKSEGSAKRKKKEVQSEEELNELRKSNRYLPPAQDPRYLKLKIKQFFDKRPPFVEDMYSLSKTMDCHYSITGEFTASNAEILMTAELYDEYEGKLEKFSHKTSFIRGYQEMAPLGEKIRFAMQGKETTGVQIDTQGVDSVLVYIDGIYLGKTPLTAKKFPVGKRELYLFKEGFYPIKQSIDLESGRTLSLDIKLTKMESTSFISVKSDVSEADVYLGMTYLGKTPIEKASIPAGQNRLRVSKAGYIDVFRPVDAKANEVSEYDVVLKEGKSEIYYPNKQYVFLDYTYKDFATYSLYGSLLFYAGYFYLNVASRRAIEDSRAQVTLVNGQALRSFYEGNSESTFLLWYAYQNQIINSSESRADYYKTMAGTLPMENRRNRQLVAGPMVIGMGVMLAAAVTFLLLGLDKETFDIGFLPYGPGANGQGFYTNVQGNGPMDGYSYFQWNARY
ncbi:PEGA domain protein [Leptospira ryugenii]|uniref:PEGA domain protein n=1 Tax=Leptospira ryugenii TaxID=1917863 RepID=A0A2P2E4M2_9LEPT|nr:PEGA domain-containing protein [Leptospira ryugenii]GBF51804.1 PEGA domain protein [Leptospira ryugenii]